MFPNCTSLSMNPPPEELKQGLPYYLCTTRLNIFTEFPFFKKSYVLVILKISKQNKIIIMIMKKYQFYTFSISQGSMRALMHMLIWARIVCTSILYVILCPRSKILHCTLKSKMFECFLSQHFVLFYNIIDQVIGSHCLGVTYIFYSVHTYRFIPNKRHCSHKGPPVSFPKLIFY